MKADLTREQGQYNVSIGTFCGSKLARTKNLSGFPSGIAVSYSMRRLVAVFEPTPVRKIRTRRLAMTLSREPVRTM